MTNHGQAEESLLGTVSFSPPSVGEGEVYNQSSVLTCSPSIGSKTIVYTFHRTHGGKII